MGWQLPFSAVMSETGRHEQGHQTIQRLLEPLMHLLHSEFLIDPVLIIVVCKAHPTLLDIPSSRAGAHPICITKHCGLAQPRSIIAKVGTQEYS